MEHTELIAEQLCRTHLAFGEASSKLQELIPSWCQARSNGDIKLIPRSLYFLLQIAGITESERTGCRLSKKQHTHKTMQLHSGLSLLYEIRRFQTVVMDL